VLQYYKIVNVSEASENPTHSPESSSSGVQVLRPAKRLKDLAVVLQHITEENDPEHVTPSYRK